MPPHRRSWISISDGILSWAEFLNCAAEDTADRREVTARAPFASPSPASPAPQREPLPQRSQASSGCLFTVKSGRWRMAVPCRGAAGTAEMMAEHGPTLGTARDLRARVVLALVFAYSAKPTRAGPRRWWRRPAQS